MSQVSTAHSRRSKMTRESFLADDKSDKNGINNGSGDHYQASPPKSKVVNMKGDGTGNGGYENLGPELLTFIAVIKLSALVIWTGGILYATYQVFLAAEEYFPWLSDPVLNEGQFTSFLGRGRDVLDREWVTFVPVLWLDLLVAFGLYHLAIKVFSRMQVLQGVTSWVSPCISLMLIYRLIGFIPALHMIAIPLVYWTLIKFGRKYLVWTLTISMIFYLGLEWFEVIFYEFDDSENTNYFFAVICAWTLSRCVSFCMDVWERPPEQKFSISSLFSFLKYVLYLPLILSGPLVTYEHFEKRVETSSSPRPSKEGNYRELGKSLIKAFLITCLVELIYHYLYFRPLSLAPGVMHTFNIWTVCGIIYWLGQVFTLKYKVFYGLSSCLAEFDGLQMYPLPTCPAYIHRYSTLWKDFDRGLYIFMVKYIYGPTIKALNDWDPHGSIQIEVKKLFASFCTFAYVYIWHNTSFEVFIWTAFNFVGITIEKFGSLLKKRIDARLNVNPVVWDFVLEPFITVPLAAMSIINSSVFCGTYYSAVGLSQRLLQTWTHSYNYHLGICFFLYCFTHVGVTVRTWEQYWTSCKSKILKMKTHTHNHKMN